MHQKQRRTSPWAMAVLLLSVIPVGLAPLACGKSTGGVEGPDQPGTDGGSDAGDGGGGGAGVCNDGVVNVNEACDDGNNAPGDGCSADCSAVDPGWTCAVAGQACTMNPACGNGIKTSDEQCDDHNTQNHDGCSSTCTVEPGYTCTTFCQATLCGDGIIAGAEECEDNDTVPTSGDGCSETCKLEKGYKCSGPDAGCVRTTCGDHVKEGTEQCDDGNNNTGDGCSPTCTFEPVCANGSCTSVCGDGVVLPNDLTEQCDDGNSRSGDGCSSTCQLEPNFNCRFVTQAPPASVEIPVVYRDFKPWGTDGGHQDFENKNGAEKNIVGPYLDSEGKPPYRLGDAGVTSTTHGRAGFDQWYRDVPNVNKTVVGTLELRQAYILSDGGTQFADAGVAPDGGRLSVDSGTYVYENTRFFPLDDAGWVAAGEELLRNDQDGTPRNFNFTSETRYWFEYKGTEVLSFFGDDDVWVYVNKRLVTDIGGVHGPQYATVALSDVATDAGLVVGKIYEAAVFQAERHVVGSQYKLTLTDFVARRTECEPLFQCGDGVVQSPQEQCDEGTNLGGYGKCAPGCLLGPRCGDNVMQSANGETCDDGNTVSGDGCSSTCAFEIN